MKHPVTVLDQIQFTLDRDRFFDRIRIESVPELSDQATEFADRLEPLVEPKSVVIEAYIDQKDDDSVVVDGIRFTSPVLGANLAEVERVFPYVSTCGAELEGIDISDYDCMAFYWLDVIKEQALSAAERGLREYMRSTFGLEKLSAMNPGSADEEVWPIEQQAGLFSLFGDSGPDPGSAVEALIGVHLTESFLMIPNKTVSGLYFVSDTEFINCSACRRENCPNRRAPFPGSD